VTKLLDLDPRSPPTTQCIPARATQAFIEVRQSVLEAKRDKLDNEMANLRQVTSKLKEKRDVYVTISNGDRVVAVNFEKSGISKKLRILRCDWDDGDQVNRPDDLGPVELGHSCVVYHFWTHLQGPVVALDYVDMRAGRQKAPNLNLLCLMPDVPSAIELARNDYREAHGPFGKESECMENPACQYHAALQHDEEQGQLEGCADYAMRHLTRKGSYTNDSLDPGCHLEGLHM